MSFQAYIDALEIKTGMTPRALLAAAAARGFEGPQVKAAGVIEWLREDYGVGRGHAMALVHVIKNGAKIPGKHVGSGGVHSDPTDTLNLDGRASLDGRADAEGGAGKR
ncbi:DUF4287 domain-containing protein [Dactylosporangium matsuzakiense]|uniref:Valyl-tRNA synthetase n=1 Tax=Dactylosporangium matsuzakiense TaxID=53360 RepID=A0A9W6KH67_9ACTN|nr:DUF4287 domain-containing protein [Dactylosporangium matsuzakiense]UWZ46071.1 DUF4287 domain-containing protein [Dactylosporangium matsuzakiense]GLL00201.1 hypothetical protein GCM10017581_019410 [Dactylosporangium matsuzakiense]